MLKEGFRTYLFISRFAIAYPRLPTYLPVARRPSRKAHTKSMSAPEDEHLLSTFIPQACRDDASGDDAPGGYVQKDCDCGSHEVDGGTPPLHQGANARCAPESACRFAARLAAAAGVPVNA